MSKSWHSCRTRSMQTDEYAEQVAKDKLGLVYEDEIIFKPEEN